MKKTFATIIEPIKNANGCGVNIFKNNGKYVWAYFGWADKIPEGMLFHEYPLGDVAFNELKAAATEAISGTGFEMFDATTADGAPAIKIFLSWLTPFRLKVNKVWPRRNTRFLLFIEEYLKILIDI